MKSRSGIQVMAGLIGMIRPLLSKMPVWFRHGRKERRKVCLRVY